MNNLREKQSLPRENTKQCCFQIGGEREKLETGVQDGHLRGGGGQRENLHQQKHK